MLEGIGQKKRDFLLVMATGTGKTRTCIAMVDALMRAGHAEKVLFLVDRIALREQSLAAFKEHLPNEPRWPNVGEKLLAKDRRVYVATYPTMLNIIRDESQHLSPHFFDFIVVDESHRSIYNTYGEVLDYFKTITLGLTATPTDIIDHNTFQLFHCEDGLPTFAYTFEEAVKRAIDTREPKGSDDNHPEMEPAKFASGCAEISNHLNGFSYPDLLNQVADISALKMLYGASANGYEKLQVFRLLGLDVGSSVIQKFINESYHIENEFICQLDPANFDTIPEYVILECDKILMQAEAESGLV